MGGGREPLRHHHDRGGREGGGRRDRPGLGLHADRQIRDEGREECPEIFYVIAAGVRFHHGQDLHALTCKGVNYLELVPLYQSCSASFINEYNKGGAARCLLYVCNGKKMQLVTVSN